MSHSDPFTPEGSSNEPSYFLGHPLEEVKSLEILGLIISHDLSLANQIAKLTSKANLRLGNLCRSRFL